MENNQDFHFTYCAAQQQEIQHIRKKYLPPETDKIEQLRTLHRSAGQKAQTWSIALGVVGSLILGTGMSLAMSDLGAILGAYRDYAVFLGILIGMIGILLVALAYPVYNRILKRERSRIAPQILQLTDELMQ